MHGDDEGRGISVEDILDYDETEPIGSCRLEKKRRRMRTNTR